MIFSGHSRSLHLLRSSSDDSLATSQDAEPKAKDRRRASPQAATTSCPEKTTPWFTPKASDKEQSKSEHLPRNEWPNGPPPSGPRSHRVAISPPAVRRSSNENEHARHISDHGSTAPFIRQSFPSSVQWRRAETLPTGSRSVDHASELGADDMNATAEDTAEAVPDPSILDPPIMMAKTNPSLENDRHTSSVLVREVLWAGELGNNGSTSPGRAKKAQHDSFSMHLDAAETRLSGRSLKMNSPTHLSPPLPKRQNGSPDDTASVVSDFTMSSGAAVSGRSSVTSGSRTRTCHKCKKAAQAASPLFKCSQCPRRYHAHCAVPKISSGSQANGAIEWICKHCVKDVQEAAAVATTKPIPLNLLHETGQQSASSPTQESKERAATAVLPLTHYKGPPKKSLEVTEGRVALPEGASTDHPKALGDSDLGRALRNTSDQRVPFNAEQPENSENAASQFNGWTFEATTVKQEFIGAIHSAPRQNSFDAPPRQASVEQDGFIEDTRARSAASLQQAAGTNLKQSIGEAPTVAPLAPPMPAATNGFRRDLEPKLVRSPSFDTPMHTKRHTSPFDMNADDPEDDGLSISLDKSLEKARRASNTRTTSGRTQQLQEAIPSKPMNMSGKKSLKHLTCYHWKQRGGCRYREDECQYAHHDTGMDEGKNTTCFWWWNTGHCKKSERECLYAHRDTGIYAKPPPGYVPQNRLHVAPRSPERSLWNSRADHYSPPMSSKDMRSPANGLAARRSPSLPRHGIVTSSLPESSWTRPTIPNLDGPTSGKSEQKVVGTDPRLLRRPSSMSVQEKNVQENVENVDTVIATSKTDINLTLTTVPTDPVTPTPGLNTAIESASSFTKCRLCDKKVFGSASLCFTCKGTKPSKPNVVVKSSPFVPETPELDTVITPDPEEQPTPESVVSKSPDKPASQLFNPLKRTLSVLGSGSDGNLFIKKKARIFKSSEPRRTNGETSPQQMISSSGKEKPIAIARSNTVPGAMAMKTPVPLDELIELERLRKQVALLEKSNIEEKEALDEARRLRVEEKERADRLNEELQEIKARNREARKSSPEEQKQIAAPFTRSKTELDVDMQNETSRSLQLAKRSMNRSKHVRRQSSIDFDGVSEASIQSPLRPKEARRDKDEMKLMRDMKARGVLFESDSDSDDGPEVPPPTPFKPPKDPLWRPLKSSRDLFEVAPQYQQENLFFDLEAKRREIASRPSRKQTFGKLLALCDRERGTANVHRDIHRGLPPRMVRTRVVDTTEDMDPFRELAPTKEVEMSLEEFLGVPENALLCTTTTGQLAYRDAVLDQWGKLRRVPDDEKFEIGTKI